MKIILSLSRLLDQLRTYHDLGSQTDEEIAVLLDRYAAGFFNDIRSDYGVAMVGLTANNGATGEFQFDISATKGGSTVDWAKLYAGLEALNPVAVTVERDDLLTICDNLVYTSLAKVWHEIAPYLTRLSVAELRLAIENICLKVVWSRPAELQPYEYEDELREIQADALLEEAGVRNPTAAHEAQKAFDRQEVEDYEAQKRQQNSDEAWERACGRI